MIYLRGAPAETATAGLDLSGRGRWPGERRGDSQEVEEEEEEESCRQTGGCVASGPASWCGAGAVTWAGGCTGGDGDGSEHTDCNHSSDQGWTLAGSADSWDSQSSSHLASLLANLLVSLLASLQHS